MHITIRFLGIDPVILGPIPTYDIYLLFICIYKHIYLHIYAHTHILIYIYITSGASRFLDIDPVILGPIPTYLYIYMYIEN
jgi:hypothetical protein